MTEDVKEFTMKNYFDFLKEGKLMGSKCKKCGKMFVPPKKVCPDCMKDDMEWVQFSGKGILATYSLVSVGTRYFANQGYNMKNPYCFGVIQLNEGPKISAHVVGSDKSFESNSNNFKVGMPLRVKFLKVEMEGREPKFDLGFEPDN